MGDVCKDINLEDLSCYLDDELAADKKDEISAHLAQCSVCCNKLKEMKSVGSLLARESNPAQSSEINLWANIAEKMPDICEVMQMDFSAYIDGELPLPAQEGINDHLKACGTCCKQFTELNHANQLIVSGLKLKAELNVDLWTSIQSRLTEDCALIAKELSIFVDQEVPISRHRVITSHLLECAPCKRRFNKLLQVGDIIRNYYVPELACDFDLFPAIKSKLQVVSFAAHKAKPKLVVRRLTAVAAAVIGLIGASYFIVAPLTNQSIQPVSAETYLLESALMEPVESAEASMYESK